MLALLAAVQIQAEVLVVLISTIIPFLVSAVTRSTASDKIRVAVATILSALAAGLTAIVGPAETVLLSQETLTRFFIAFATAFVTYKTLGKPNQINQRIAPDKGIG